MPLHPAWYVLVLPDDERAGPIAARLAGASVLRHASGRPWLVHTYPADQVVANSAGPNRLAALGFSSATPESLQRAADRLRGVGDADDLAHRLAGSHVLAVSAGGEIRAQGTATGVRRVFTALVDGCRLVCDRADVLAGLGRFPMDETVVAIRMLREIPHPLGELPVWQGVQPVSASHYAAVDASGRRLRTVSWWRRPQPTLSRGEGAIRLGAALDEAVATRTRAGGTVYADLSGGFDSTPQAYFAARGPSRLLAGTAYNDDPGGGEDLVWAKRALEAMPQASHNTFSTDEMPQFYGGLRELDALLDEPSDAYRAAPRMVYMMNRARDLGARAYLNGQGGDELLFGHPRTEHTLFRQRPLLALRRLRQYQLLEELTVRQSFGALLDRRGYRQWLSDILAATAERDEHAKPVRRMDWDAPMHWPRWYPAGIRAAIVERVRKVCAEVEPLGLDLASHTELAAIRQGARSTRGSEQLGAGLGMAFQAPISDDRVAEAVLAVRREERTEPKAFKPLMREAMRGRLPDEFLNRSRKNSGAPQTVRGIRRHEPDLLELCEESPLAELGIVDLGLLAEHAFPRGRWQATRDLDTTLNGAVFTRNHRRARALAPAAAEGRSAVS